MEKTFEWVNFFTKSSLINKTHNTGVETFFSKIKGRLCIENFTGKSLEAIKQDFWATIFLSNLETIMTEDTEQNLNKKLTTKKLCKRKINKAVSFNAIKNMAFELFYRESNIEKIIDKLTNMFLTGTLVSRSNRQVERKDISHFRSLMYQKCIKKQVF